MDCQLFWRPCGSLACPRGAGFAVTAQAVPFGDALMDEFTDIAAKRDLIEGMGVTVEEMRAVARRQLKGSILAGLLVIGAAGSAALHPLHQDTATKRSHLISIPRHQTPTASDGALAARY